MSTNKRYYMQKLNQVKTSPFQLPSIKTSHQEMQLSNPEQNQQKNMKNEEFYHYFSKKVQSRQDTLKKVKIQQKKFWQYQQIKTEDRLNSFLRQRIIETTDALQERSEEALQMKSQRYSNLYLDQRYIDKNSAEQRYQDQHRLQISLPHLLPVIRYKQNTIPPQNNVYIKKSPICIPLRPCPSPIHSIGNNSTREESNTLSKEFLNFQQYSAKQMNQSSIVDLNSIVKIPPQKNQAKQLLVDQNLEKLIKMRNKKQKMYVEFNDNSISDYYQEEKPIPIPHLNSDKIFVHKIEMKQREKQTVMKQKCSHSYIDPSNKVLRLKERIAIAYSKIEKSETVQVKKVKNHYKKPQNTNKIQEFNQRLEKLAFHEVKGWQGEEEEFEHLGEYINYSAKQ